METLDAVAFLSSSKTYLKDMSGRLKKKEDEKTQKTSDTSVAGRGEEKAVWTLRRTDGGAQSRRPAVYLSMVPCLMSWCNDSGHSDRI